MYHAACAHPATREYEPDGEIFVRIERASAARPLARRHDPRRVSIIGNRIQASRGMACGSARASAPDRASKARAVALRERSG